MSVDELTRAKMYRLEELRKYQAHYGPNTPYPIIVEINKLETELRRSLQAGSTRATPVVKKNKSKKKTNKKNKSAPAWQFWRMSQATFDLIATIAFIGLVFLLGSIVFATYMRTRPGNAAAYAPDVMSGEATPTRRPTFTPTADPNAPVSEGVAEVAVVGDSFLPTAVLGATDIPTPVPTLTPSTTLEATATPVATDTPVPADTPPPPPPTRPTNTPEPPTPPPAPSFPFAVVEQGNRLFQKTDYHVITVYVAAVSEGNIPLGGYKVVGDHVPSGQHVESAESAWEWNVVNCLDCDYAKQGNLKFEPGPFTDGVWNIYLADPAGTPLSETVSLSYATDPEQWVWDFIIFRRKSG